LTFDFNGEEERQEQLPEEQHRNERNRTHEVDIETTEHRDQTQIGRSADRKPYAKGQG
jgi:hypothetical protein